MTKFMTIPFFVQMALLHVGFYLAFAFVGLLTQNIYGWFNNRFPIAVLSSSTASVASRCEFA